MKNAPTRPRTITIAQRGQIIQRVIVDGWTTTAAAATFGVPERLVTAWVADYRRHGMASLRHDPHKTIVAETVRLTVLRPVRAILRKITIVVRRFFAIDPLVQPSPLRRLNDDHRGGGS